jgi:molybdopterin molybdotransferase
MTRPALLDFDTALAQLLALAAPLDRCERVPTADALDRVLASDVHSTIDVPPMDNAQMDGWAVRCADLADDRPLSISQRVPAGAVPAPLAPGTVARIFTGATIPPGADAVVMQEQAEAVDAGVRFSAVPAPGEWIRRAGEDVRRDSVVMRAGGSRASSPVTS